VTVPESNGAAELSGTRVATARHEAGLTQKDLAAQLGVSLWKIEQLESAAGSTAGPLEALAHATGKPESWFTETDRPVRPQTRELLPAAATSAAATRGEALVLASLATLVLIRFFTEVVHVLPRIANFVDIPIFVALAVAASLSRPLQAEERRDTTPFVGPALVFLVICAVATLANPSRVEAAPALLFLYGYLAPVGVYVATYRLWAAGRALSLSRLIVGLGLLQLLVVLFIDLPRLVSTGNPDEVSGTFGENAYQLVFFLLLFGALLAGIFTFEQNRRIARAVPFLFVALLGTIFLAQYRSLLITTAATVVLIGVLLGTVKLRGLVLGGLVAIAFVVTLNYTAKAFPILRLGPAVEAFTTAPTSYVKDRASALNHVGRLYGDNPRYIVTGTGPGTYSSRAWQTFGLLDSSSQASVAGSYAGRLVHGGEYHTDVSDKYIYPRAQHGEIVQGSRALTTPYSDYSSLMAEVGVLGLVTMLFLYGRALAHAGRMTLTFRRTSLPADPVPAIALAAMVALFVLLQMGILQSWLEVSRIAFPTWIMLAVASKEFRAREGDNRATT
jgi:transcriptional regulator with XRE-family HTH domain